jgi:enoyl-CoA hydratase
MGGGVGVSVHGSHRIVTEKVVFAMPETGIGLFPDVGGSHFLPRCPGQIGMFLALAGTRLKTADCLYAGIGTQHVPSARLNDLEAALAAAEYGKDPHGTVDRVLEDFLADAGGPPLAQDRPLIDHFFALDSVEEIVHALEHDGGDWALAQARAMRAKSPTSMKVAFRQLREGARRDFDDCMRMEYRLARRFIAGHDFYEGVRATVIDKDQTPHWRPARLEEVSEAEVDAYFAPLGADELTFD